VSFGYGKRRLTVEWSKVTIDAPFNRKMLKFGHMMDDLLNFVAFSARRKRPWS
jgi:hypothetical protein